MAVCISGRDLARILGGGMPFRVRGTWYSLLGVAVNPLVSRLEHAVHVEPPREFVEPACAGGLLRIHAEAVSALLEQVELRWALCREPALDDAHIAAPEERIIGGARDE